MKSTKLIQLIDLNKKTTMFFAAQKLEKDDVEELIDYFEFLFNTEEKRGLKFESTVSEEF
ncbi:MAG: hypothetical protein JXR48_17290 [Candidatus Delongbacteria bacterium]|nr:hypothetical protein [Candidatus Delongbacteria bacterium]MBN2836714.1 hypothetical protein [Candidatus Delongbacteria bacterium]